MPKHLVPSTRRAIVDALEDRRLFSALVPSNSVLVFNASVAGYPGGGQPSHADVLSITNTAATPIAFRAHALAIVKDPADPTDESGQFAIVNSSSLPGMLGPGQSAQIEIQYFASAANAIQSAVLQITSSDAATPVIDISLRGLGTTGFFGYNEPSLANILRANNIPTIVGAGPNDANASNSQYPQNPDPSSQEAPLQRLMKAGPGAVTITPLASFDTNTQPALRVGYYSPGSPADRTELFTIGQVDSQTVNPTASGATSFDPGNNIFGLYAEFPGIATANGAPDIHYSESALNTLDPAHPTKFRFFPLENPDRTVVSGAYVVAAEDFNSPQFNSFTNFVGIIRNVKAAPDAVNAPVLGLENPDLLPFSDRLIFNRIQVPNPTVGDKVHDTNQLQIDNSGDQALSITGIALSDPANWQLVNPPSLPATIEPGGTMAITIRFIAQSAPSVPYNETNDSATINDGGLPSTQAGGVWNATLTISSNDPIDSSRQVQLAGYWQHLSEHEEEAGVQTIVNLLGGYQTQIAASPLTEYPEGSTPIYYGEEARNAFLWQAADPTQPVTVNELAGEYSEGVNPAFTGYYLPGHSSNPTVLFRQDADASQSLLPPVSGGSGPAQGSFTPPGTFGWDLDGVFSEDSLNPQQYGAGHLLRAYPLRDRNGNLIPNAWLLLSKYAPTNGFKQNYDFNDIMAIAFNVRPINEAPAPADVQASASPGAVAIQWAPVSDPSLIGYNIYRAAAPTGPFMKLNSSPFSQTSFSDAGPPAGTGWYYRVSAVDAAGESQAAGAFASPLTVQTPPPGGQPPAGYNPPLAGDFALIGRGTRRVISMLTASSAQAIYAFTLDRPSRVSLRLAGLRADADLQLVDVNGNVIQTSARPGRRPEAINAVLGAGRYYVRVYLIGTVRTPIRLTLGDKPLPIRHPRPPKPKHHRSAFGLV